MSTETFKLFKSHIPSVQYIFTNGKIAHFKEGRYATRIQSEIEELTTTCEAGHPTFYIDNTEAETDKEFLDPMSELRARFFKEFQEAAAGKVVNPGDSNNAAVGEGAGISTSAVTAKLAALSNTGKK